MQATWRSEKKNKIFMMQKQNKVIFTLFIGIAALLGACLPDNGGPQVSAHRGAAYLAPENTLAALDSCVKYGIDYMECDVCISKDSVFYLLHDSTLDRTTNGAGDIGEWLSEDIDTLDAGAWFGEEFRGQRVPRFADVLRRAKQHNLGITVDYRSGDFKTLLELVRSEGMLERCMFTFWDEEDAKAFRALAPEVNGLQAYVKSADELDEVVAKLKPNIAVIRIEALTREFVVECRRRNLQVLVLSLGLDEVEEKMQKAVKLGADVVATDRAEVFVKKFRRPK